MPLSLDEAEAETLRSLITAVDMAASWKHIAEQMADAGIDDPEAAYNALRDKAFA